VTSTDVLEKLTIETPEQTTLEFSLAGVGSRFLAVALDTLIQYAAILLVAIATGLVVWGTGPVLPQLGNWGAAAALIAFFVLYYGYFAVFEILWNGQTPGKRLAGLRVIQDSGRPVNAYQAVLRNVVRIVDQLPGIYGVGIISVLLSERNKRLGDLAAGTVVVHEKPLEGAAMTWNAPEGTETTGQPAAAGFAVSRLSPEEIQLLETFLARRSHLTAEIRAYMARQIAARLATRLEVQPAERPPSDETFIETLAHQSRAVARFR
jgi:uncharacterized RDD family membrane protein YckC